MTFQIRSCLRHWSWLVTDSRCKAHKTLGLPNYLLCFGGSYLLWLERTYMFYFDRRLLCLLPYKHHGNKREFTDDRTTW